MLLALRGAEVHGRAVLPRGPNIPAEQQLCPTGSMLVGRAALRPGGGRPQGPSQREAFHLIENNSDWWRSNCPPADSATDVWVGTPRCGVQSAQRADPTISINRHPRPVKWLGLFHWAAFAFSTTACRVAQLYAEFQFSAFPISAIPCRFQHVSMSAFQLLPLIFLLSLFRLPAHNRRMAEKCFNNRD